MYASPLVKNQQGEAKAMCREKALQPASRLGDSQGLFKKSTHDGTRKVVN